jgi:Tol biopolymer transport system component
MRRLSGPRGRDEVEPAWSPDGLQIAFSSNRAGNGDVYVMQADGAGVTQLTRDPWAELYFPRSAHDGEPTWSPQGDQLAFISGRDNTRPGSVDLRLYVMDADGANQRALLGAEPGVALYPAWSPDGQSIAFGDLTDLYIFTFGAAQPQHLPLPFEAEHPHWSTDARQLIFVGWEHDQWNIYTAQLDGSHLTQLTHGPGDAAAPQWSPDGTRLLFASNRDGDWDLYVMQADGSQPLALTANAANDADPAWSPDGRQIVFASDRDGDWDLYVLQADGTGLVQLTGLAD